MGHFKTTAILAAALLTGTLAGAAFAQSPDEALAALANQTLSTGPSGESPVSASEVTLSDDELAKIKAMGATAAIVMHYGGDD
ncbi:MAG: sugar transporter substrate-binding protein, partial [Devosia sp.]|nr:sugar transporter substrate-binding protein [Devosia sp.]